MYIRRHDLGRSKASIERVPKMEEATEGAVEGDTEGDRGREVSVEGP